METIIKTNSSDVFKDNIQAITIDHPNSSIQVQVETEPQNHLQQLKDSDSKQLALLDENKPSENLEKKLQDKDRTAFMIKAYLLHLFMWLVAIGLSILSTFCESYRNWQRKFVWICPGSIALFILIMISTINKHHGSSYPKNYILLTIYSLLFANGISYICLCFNPICVVLTFTLFASGVIGIIQYLSKVACEKVHWESALAAQFGVCLLVFLIQGIFIWNGDQGYDLYPEFAFLWTIPWMLYLAWNTHSVIGQNSEDDWNYNECVICSTGIYYNYFTYLTQFIRKIFPLKKQPE